MKTAKDWVIFRAGKWNDETFTTDDLDNMVRSFNANEPPHIIVGHFSDYKGKTLIPSFGRIVGGLKRVGNDLVAVGAEFHEKLAEWMNEGFFTGRSVEMTGDNKRILAVGMLGAMPPAVKGLPAMDNLLDETVLSYAQKGKTKIVEFADDAPVPFDTDAAEAAGVQDTFKNISEICARWLSDMEELLTTSDDPDRLWQEVNELQGDLCHELSLHGQFIEKLEQMEEAAEQEYSEKKSWLKEFMEMFKRKKSTEKGIAMDAAKEKEFAEKVKVDADKIAALEAQVKEFSEKERVANEAKAKAEGEAKDVALKAEIKQFCESLKAEGKYVAADDEAGLPEKMFAMAKAGIDYKPFLASRPVIVPPGNMNKEFAEQVSNDTRPDVIKNAEKYVKDNPKEFARMPLAEATARAHYLHSMGQIKFTGK